MVQCYSIEVREEPRGCFAHIHLKNGGLPTSKCSREGLLPLHGSLLNLKSASKFGHQKDTPKNMCLNCNLRLIWLKQLHCEKCWRYVMSFPAQAWPRFFTKWCSHHLSHPWRSFPCAESQGRWLPAWLQAEQRWEGIQGVEARRKGQGQWAKRRSTREADASNGWQWAKQ